MELIRCDEISHYIYPKPVLAALVSLKRRFPLLSFDAFYCRVMAGYIAGAKRVKVKYTFDGPSKIFIYERLNQLLGDNYSLSDLDMIIDICRTCKTEEVINACSVASNRRIFSAQYVKGIILGTRRLKARQKQQDAMIFKKIENVPQLQNLPKTKVNKEHWTRRVKDLQDNATFDQALKKKTSL